MKGSVTVLNASAEKGSSLFAALEIVSSVPGITPSTAGTSNGDGRYSPIASSNGWTHLFLSAVPHSTGTILLEMVAVRMAFFRS